MMEKYVKAGRIASKVRRNVKREVTSGMKVQDLIMMVESSITKENANLAFPCTVSINGVASHYTSPLIDNTILLDRDIVKIDLGVEVDGFVADTATSLIVSGDNPDVIPNLMPGRCDNGEVSEDELTRRHKLLEATHEALYEAISIIRGGVEVSKISSVIQEVASKYSFYPIANITGHNIERYKLHAGISIPNVKNNNNTILTEGDVIAIEPYLTYNGRNAVKTGESHIYSYLRRRPLYNSNSIQLLDVISKNYSRFPFALRHLEKENIANMEEAFNPLVSSRAVFPYPVLVQPDNHPVSQFEHTIIVEKRGCRITTQ